jgi:hypothetical protein
VENEGDEPLAGAHTWDLIAPDKQRAGGSTASRPLLNGEDFDPETVRILMAMLPHLPHRARPGPEEWKGHEGR